MATQHQSGPLQALPLALAQDRDAGDQDWLMGVAGAPEHILPVQHAHKLQALLAALCFAPGRTIPLLHDGLQGSYRERDGCQEPVSKSRRILESWNALG